MMAAPQKPTFAEFVAGLKQKKAKAKGGKNANGEGKSSPTSVASLWKDECVEYLVTTTVCKCGAHSTQTNPVPMLRRFHPRRGIISESIAVAHLGTQAYTLPVRKAFREVGIQNCHECLIDPDVNPLRQDDLFIDWFDEGGELVPAIPNEVKDESI